MNRVYRRHVQGDGLSSRGPRDTIPFIRNHCCFERRENPRFSHGNDRGFQDFPLTFYDTGSISRYDPQFLSGLDDTCAYPSRDARSGSRAFEDVRDGEPEG